MKSITLLLCLICAGELFAQPPGAVPQAQLESGDSLTTLLSKGHEDEFAVFNGRQHFGYPQALEGHPYYPVNTWQPGSVKYDNTWYRNLHLMYDAFAGVVIVQHPSGMSLTLNSDHVQEFYIGGLSFLNIKALEQSSLRSIFYQQLVSGDLAVLVKRTKKLDEKINGLQVEQRYLTSDQYYTWKDNRIASLRKEKDIMNLTGDRKPAISQQLKSRGIRYRKSPEEAMILIAQLYNNQSTTNR